MHFTNPFWLLGLFAIPLFWILDFHSGFKSALEKHIDPHLLAVLLKNKEPYKKWKNCFLRSFVWACLMIALAGLRFNYKEVELFGTDASIVVVLDLSESMNATDVKPSRLAAAKRKIEDILKRNEGAKFGLIAFAEDAHMIAPLTDDARSLLRLLPSIDTDIIHIQGSKLKSALEMAEKALDKEAGINKAVYILSDGGFNDVNAVKRKADALKNRGIKLFATGIGTLEGAPLMDKEGRLLKKQGNAVISKLELDHLSTIAVMDKETFFDEKIVLGSKKEKIWEEQFYLFLLPTLPIFLWWFRRGALCMILAGVPWFGLNGELFKNRNEVGKEAFESGDYAKAIEFFSDPYNQGVACYRAGEYEKAEEMFCMCHELKAKYNLGNALALQEKLKEAVGAYEEVLKEDPHHIKAKENLEIVKKLLKEQDQEQKQQQENHDSQEESKEQESGSEEEGEKRLERIKDDPKEFLKNKFYIESRKNGTKEELDPW